VAIELQEVAFLVITVLFGILLGLFVWQTVRHRRSATILVISLSVGFLACIFAIFSSGIVIPLTSLQENIFQALQLNAFGFQFFFFYVFIERLRSKEIHSGLLVIMVSFLFLQTFSLWLRICFNNIGDTHQVLWFLADMGYTLAGILVYLGLSVPVYLKTYKYTREIKPVVIAVALGLIGIGFIFSFFNDILDFMQISVGVLENLAELTMPLQAIGLFIFTSIYLSDIDYLYRNPFDVFLLMVVTKAGIPLHTVKLKTRSQIDIEGDLLSGLLSAMNNVFEEIFKIATIRSISSEKIHIMMDPGKEIISIVISDKISYFLIEALKRYTKMFEEQFSTELKEKVRNTVQYKTAINLIKPVFPFFKVEKML